jgi:hypothetical protein
MLERLNTKKLNHKDTKALSFTKYFLVLLCVLSFFVVQAQKSTGFSQLEKDFLHPPKSAKPWVFWYWMNGNVSKQGITADLEAMKEVGLGGAYLMFIKDTVNPSVYKPAVSQLSKPWFEMVSFAITEAKRLSLELGFHVSDGFALAGGPWITPELSMQKVVWSKLNIKGGTVFNDVLPQPEIKENYYKDIEIYAYPTPNKAVQSTQNIVPIVSTSNGTKADFLIKTNSKEGFRADLSAWIQYAFVQLFTCRTIIVRTNGNNYQSHRLIIQSSNDGINFKTITRLEPPRHGWQDTDADVTHSILTTTAKYFRFMYDKAGTEPGSEDLDNAKWKPTLKVSGIELSSEPTINQYESKNGEVWRISKRTSKEQIADSLCVPLNKLINITSFYKNGKLNWTAPKGNWTIIRIGHTSTSHKNETAGGGKGLECDKFNAEAVKLQFNNWFGKIYSSVDEATAKEVIKVFHVDSWECGSQNWSPVFANEFKKRRGYDLLPYLPVMAGVPVQSIVKSEQVLFDIRQTISELVVDVFYTQLKKLSAEKNTLFSAESVAPTMLSDGMLHYKKVDLPMGEFWNNSPTHDKPNDMLDAISAAHIYGKNIVQAEAFTTVRMNWNEHPSNLKTLGDRNFALGINKMVLHVFSHNPFMDKKPGVTLDGVGLYYQRDQTWFKQSKAWIDYLSRCQAMLQQGRPVVDIAVFTGEELPRRSVLPDRLVNTLPGIFGKERVDFEAKRMKNEGQPMQQKPDGVSNSLYNIEPADWVNPLNGYAYDSFNPDALNMATVKDGMIVLPSGMEYKILVLPGSMKMNPDNIISNASIKKIIQLVKDGATVLMDEAYKKYFALNGAALKFTNYKEASIAVLGKGKIMLTPYRPSNFKLFQVEKDLEVITENSSTIAYTHRKMTDADIYFVSNQTQENKTINLSFRVAGKQPEIWDAVSGQIDTAYWNQGNGKTIVGLTLNANESKFIVFRNQTSKLTNYEVDGLTNIRPARKKPFIGSWWVQFDTSLSNSSNGYINGYMEHIGDVVNRFPVLLDWSKSISPIIKYYSGTAVYKNTFSMDKARDIYLEIPQVYNLATIKINGVDCGTLWTAPFRLDISKEKLKQGTNTIEIAVTNTWHNRLIGDNLLSATNERKTFTTAPFRLQGKPLQPAGLVGEVKIWEYTP